ncbi:MSHA biogenesis protein MshP [Ferrimonas sediminum]|uniref:MSHA biogenesis protein MshP n=1 Tax=Ferrimonas sediminum TaxID=718193 RepID=A0A1G8KAW2_9GAMM|nr:hypothetical protein [Ferrimonas sediminum]SDI39990.1 MSHA biogenesis protein MshP [Ferrimonas sediminum]
MKTFPSRQRGSTLIIALFVIVVMLMLGVALMQMLENQDDQMLLEVNGSRTWAAGQSGLDWGLARVLNRGAEVAATACTNAAGTLTPGAGLPNNGGFPGCRVEVACTHMAFMVDGVARNRFMITADASCGPTGLTVNRSFESQAFD